MEREELLKFSQTVLDLKGEEERNERKEFLNTMKGIADQNNEEMKKFISEKKDEFLKYGRGNNDNDLRILLLCMGVSP
ncbi:unnamed protein product [Meloidogyne enterolobii]|uniref:Uncharacterized protein n=1 Tax=Meloidogyne enterolobii TaxID=390850 RepID=A0ACB1B3C1_MELEN